MRTADLRSPKRTVGEEITLGQLTHAMPDVTIQVEDAFPKQTLFMPEA